MASAFAATLTKGDLAIAISYHGLSQETVTFLKEARRSGCHTVAITTDAASSLAQVAGHVIELSAFGAWPKDGSARLMPSMILLTEFVARLIEEASDWG